MSTTTTTTPIGPEDVHGVRLANGRHRGQLLTRTSRSYLLWMVRAGHPQAAYAKAELDRRGDAELPAVEVSAHAINRASTRCLKLWKKTRLSQEEGLHAWLARMAAEAMMAAGRNKGRLDHRGLRLVIETDPHDCTWPIVMSVMRAD